MQRSDEIYHGLGMRIVRYRPSELYSGPTGS